MKRVVIIGAGVAGLSAGCHLAASGYDVEVLEAHSGPGGLCTAWRRGEFLFDGCLHWIPGAHPDSPFYTVNDEVLDMESLPLKRYDTVFEIETLETADPEGVAVFRIYSDCDRFEAYLNHVAPDDGDLVAEIVGIARELARWKIPPSLDPSELAGIGKRLAMVRYLPLLRHLKRWSRISFRDLAARAKSPFLKEALSLLRMDRDYPIVVLLMQVAFGHNGSVATPLGGSLAFARRIEACLTAAGGRARYGARVSRIIVEGGAARGVLLESGESIPADIVISAADGHFTLFEALGGRYLTPGLAKLYAGETLEPFESLVYVSLGIGRDLADLPRNRLLSLREPLLLPDGSRVARFEPLVINDDPAVAPAGKAVVSAMLLTRNTEYWVSLRSGDPAAYAAAKRACMESVVGALEERYGNFAALVEEWDVATPATFVRYTGNWLGSYEGWYPSRDFLAAKPLPSELPGLRDFFMIGQWTVPAGGVTPCIKSGRDIARIICARDRRPWRAPTSYARQSAVGVHREPQSEPRGEVRRTIGGRSSEASGAARRVEGESREHTGE